MVRPDIHDTDYLDYLGEGLYRQRYVRWKERMLGILEGFLTDLEDMTPEDAIEKWKILPKDVAMMVRLNYITAEEAERFDLVRIERSLPM